ncbi:MAG: hypothetical protein K8R46_14940 [Pirellulales bacterium]|nr:hypothetical protein [Pirellulales bacterium]
MKKLLAGFLAGLAGFLTGLVVGLILSAVDWEAILPFSDTTYGIASPDIEESYDLMHFRTNVPKFSSGHFFFRTGFGDVDEYWSFVLPPERARAFLDSYVKKNALPTISRNTNFPAYISIRINGSYDHKDWRSDLWFDSLADLSEVYYKKYLFCGYSAEKNRIYLMNWND